MAQGCLDAAGAQLAWTKRPKVEVFIEPDRKKPKPQADISALTPGAIAMNDKAKAALGEFLSQFGQFLEMGCGTESRWFYNVTNLVSCIDEAHSTKRPSGAIAKEAFTEEKVPVAAAVFKDPLTAAASIYVNETGKNVLEELISVAGIVGAVFVEPGAPPKKPRPRF